METKRLRVFAGPNGSGKSTIINSIRNTKVNGKSLDFGIYVNADDIAKTLTSGALNFSDYSVTISRKEFISIAESSGLLDGAFSKEMFSSSFIFSSNSIRLKSGMYLDQVSQICSEVLREKLLSEGKKFSFETVFSHPSKVAFLAKAMLQGYKVYLYFVSTESPEINKYRVKLRVLQNGHNVPDDKIESRYFRTLGLMYHASQYCYQAFYYDNSANTDSPSEMYFARFKLKSGKKEWEIPDQNSIPEWFKKYYRNQPENQVLKMKRRS